MTAKIFHIEPVGDVTFTVNERSRRIRLSIKSDGEIVVSMPQAVSYRDAIHFVESKTEWIRKQKTKIKSRSTVFAPEFTPESCFRTRFHKLAITKGNTDKVYNRVGNGVIQIFIPERVDHEQPRIQEFIKNTLVDVMRWDIQAIATQASISYSNGPN